MEKDCIFLSGNVHGIFQRNDFQGYYNGTIKTHGTTMFICPKMIFRYSFLFSLCLSVSLLAIVLYRVPLTWSRWWCKLAHAGLLFMAVVLAVVGLCAAFDFHSANNIPHLYSLHSWTGISTVALFTLQVYHMG